MHYNSEESQRNQQAQSNSNPTHVWSNADYDEPLTAPSIQVVSQAHQNQPYQQASARSRVHPQHRLALAIVSLIVLIPIFAIAAGMIETSALFAMFMLFAVVFAIVSINVTFAR